MVGASPKEVRGFMSQKKKLRVFYINESGAPTGGAELYIIFLYKILTRMGHAVNLIYNRWEQNTFLGEEGDGVLLEGVDSSKEDSVSRRTLRRLKILIEEKNPDLVHLHNVSRPELVKDVSDCLPTLRSVYDYRMVCPMEFKIEPDGTFCQKAVGSDCLRCMAGFGLDRSTSRKILRQKRKEIKANRALPRLIVGSRYVKKQLVLNGFSAKRVSVLPYCVLSEDLARRSVKPVRKKNILFIGRGIKTKGLMALLKAFFLLRNREATLSVLGEGPILEKAKKYAAKLRIGSGVKFVGWVKHDSLADYYQKCSLLVVPSLWPEPFGLVGLEAMFFKKPVVAFDVGGIPDWLEDGKTGFLVEKGNIKSLAKRIDLLLSDFKLASAMGKEGYKRVKENFTAQTHVEKLIKIYEDLARA